MPGNALEPPCQSISHLPAVSAQEGNSHRHPTGTSQTPQSSGLDLPVASDMQLQQQYDDLVGDLAVQRQSQPHWPHRSRSSLMPLTSAQQLQRLQDATSQSDQWARLGQQTGNQLMYHMGLQHQAAVTSQQQQSYQLSSPPKSNVSQNDETHMSAQTAKHRMGTTGDGLTAAVATPTSMAALDSPLVPLHTELNAVEHQAAATRMSPSALNHLHASATQSGNMHEPPKEQSGTHASVPAYPVGADMLAQPLQKEHSSTESCFLPTAPSAHPVSGLQVTKTLPMDSGASSAGLPPLPGDPFGQTLASLSPAPPSSSHPLPEDPFGQTPNALSAAPPSRAQPLPEDLFCQHNPLSAQSMLAKTHTPTSGKGVSPFPAPAAAENEHSSTTNVLIETSLSQLSSRQSPLGSLPEESQGVANGPADSSKPSVSTASISQIDKPSPPPVAAAQPSMASVSLRTLDSLKQSPSSQQRVAQVPNSLGSAASTDAQSAMLQPHQKAVAELSLRASLVEWLADAVAKKLAAAFQNTPGASISARPDAKQENAASQALDYAATSGMRTASLTLLTC